jgi:hypothetical protein
VRIDAKNFTALSYGVTVNLSISKLARQRPEMRDAPWNSACGAPLSFSRARLGYQDDPRRFARGQPFLHDAAEDSKGLGGRGITLAHAIASTPRQRRTGLEIGPDSVAGCAGRERGDQMMNEFTRSGKPVLVNLENVAWAVPNESGGTRIVFNATPYLLEKDGKEQPVFMDMDVDQSIDQIGSERMAGRSVV